MLASGAVSVVQPQRSGMASGANNTFRQVGIATGIAVLGAVFQSQIVAHTTAALNKSAVRRRGPAPRRRAAARGACRRARCARRPPPSRRGGPRSALLHAYHVGFSTTLNHLMDIGAVVALVGAICGFALVRQRDFVDPDRGAERACRPQGGRRAPGGRRGAGRAGRRRARRACLSRSRSRAPSSGSSR